jgi:hypothetical protein
MLFQGQTSVQGRAVVLKRTTNDQRLLRTQAQWQMDEDWCGGITDQTWNISVAN